MHQSQNWQQTAQIKTIVIKGEFGETDRKTQVSLELYGAGILYSKKHSNLKTGHK